MKADLITDSERGPWNDLMAGLPDPLILQSYEWGEVKKRFGWQPLRIALRDAAISILKRQVPYIGRSIFYAPSGQVTPDLLKAVKELAREHKAISLKIDPFLPEEEAGKLTEMGFIKAKKQIQPRVTFIVDLSRPLDEILGSFEEKTRYNTRLAERKEVTVIEDASEKGIKTFHGIYKETAGRDNFLIHPERYYQAIRQEMFERGLGSNFLAYYEGKPIAGVIIFCFGSRIWYMYGASLSSHRNVMPNHLLHWEIIKWAKERGYKSYDLWGIPANPTPDHPLWGVYRFKKGYNGELAKLVGAYDYPFSPILYNMLENGVSLWQNMRSLIAKGKISDSLGE